MRIRICQVDIPGYKHWDNDYIMDLARTETMLPTILTDDEFRELTYSVFRGTCSANMMWTIYHYQDLIFQISNYDGEQIIDIIN